LPVKAIYAGSFDCYTNGHNDIVRKAAALFDELHIVIANNSEKQRRFPAELMLDAIRETVAEEGIDNCSVSICSGMVAEYCIENDIRYFVRGLRNSLDYNYEENIAAANKLIAPNLETIYFRAENSAISSSLIDEMIKYNQDIANLVPPAVRRAIFKYLGEQAQIKTNP
jgi:pantetheine-phosphate adenylyltransferase